MRSQKLNCFKGITKVIHLPEGTVELELNGL